MSQISGPVMSMPPPAALPDSQESNSTTTSSRDFPSNAYAPATTDDPTPPSSASQRQDRPSDARSRPTSSHGIERRVSQHDSDQARASQEGRQSTTSSTSSRISGSPTHGSKRTASGAVKLGPPVGMYPRSPEAGPKNLHSRNLSTDTTTSSIGDLSAQLKSRLSHAMRKVQSSKTPSHLASPTSATSTTFSGDRSYHSSHSIASNSNNHARSLSQVIRARDTTNPDHFYTSQNLTTQSESYERGQPMRPPALAPAPTLTAPRHTNGMLRPPKGGTSQPSASRISATLARAQTPTQQEQDAVDTLIFMSSPANSGRYPRDRDGAPATMSMSGHPSPLRTEFGNGQQQRAMRTLPNGAPLLTQMTSASSSSEEEYCARVNGHGGGMTEVETEQRRAKRRSLGLGAFRSEREVDRMLDRMAGEEVSDGGEMEERSYEKRGYPNVNGEGGRR